MRRPEHDLLTPGGTPTTEGSETRATRWYRLVKHSKRAETGGGESERPIVSLKRGNHSEGPRGEKGTPCHDTVGGTHGGCMETLNRSNKTTTDRGTRSAKSRDGVHIPGLFHRHQLAVPGIPPNPQGRRRRSGRTDGRGLRSGPGGQPSVAAGPSQVRHVLCAPSEIGRA